MYSLFVDKTLKQTKPNQTDLTDPSVFMCVTKCMFCVKEMRIDQKKENLFVFSYMHWYLFAQHAHACVYACVCICACLCE